MSAITRLGRWTFMTVAILVIVMASVLIAAQTGWGENRARALLLKRANEAFAGRLDIGRLDYTLSGRAVAERVTLTHLGETVFSADRVEVSYRPWRLITGDLGLELVTVTNPIIRIIEGPDGWNVTSLMRERERQQPSNASFSIEGLQIRNGTVEIRPLKAPARRIVELVADADLSYARGRLRTNIGHATARDADTDIWLEELQTRITAGDGLLAFEDVSTLAAGSRITGGFRMATTGRRELDVDMHAEPLNTGLLARYVPAVERVGISPTIDLTARGTIDQLSGRLRVQSMAGNFTSQFMGGTTDQGLRLRGQADVANLNLEPWFGRANLRSDITGRGNFNLTTSDRRTPEAPLPYRVEFDGRFREIAIAGYAAENVDARGVATNDAVDAHATGRAYGASVMTDATWKMNASQLTARGDFSSLDLRRLPRTLNAPELESHVGGKFDIFVDTDTAAGDRGASWRADVTFANSTVEGATIAAGTTAFTDATQPVMRYRIQGTVGDLVPSRFAKAFPEPPDALVKFDGSITGRIELEGSGTTADTANTIARVDLHDSILMGVNVSAMTASASLTNKRLVADVKADFAGATNQTFGLDDRTPFRAAGHALVHAQIADVTQPITFRDVTGTADVNLTSAEVRGIPVDSLALQAEMQNGTANIAKLEVTSPAATVSASGALALEGSGRSDLGFEITVSDASKFSDLAGRPLAGSVTLDGRVTGSADNPSASGQYAASRIGVSNISALSAGGTFDVTVLNRNFKAPQAKMTTEAAFIEVGGTEIRSAKGTVSYDGTRMIVDAAIEQGGRALTIGGSLVPHPDHREIHVTALSVSAGGTTWATPAGQEAVVRWAENSLDIRNLRFVRDASAIRVDGRVGTGGAESAEPLVVNFENVPLEDFTNLMLTSQKLTGQLNGTARITGALDAPDVAADITVLNGTVNGVAFDRLAGQTTWSNDTLGVDVRLEAGTSGTLTAAGTMPLGRGDDLPPYNLRVNSDAVNLAFFQPLLSHVEELTGSGQFNIVVGGTSKAPTFNGTVGITKAAFSLTATGITYHGLEMRAVADGSDLNIESFQLLDPDGDAATLTGSLRIASAGTPTGFNLRFNATNFDLMNNQFGEVVLSPDLRFSGDLATPLVVGTILVERGQLEVSDILERVGSAPYKSAETSGAKKVEAAAQIQTGPLAGGSYSISLDFQNQLNLRGRDLRTARGPIGLGDVNITLGGALTIAKDPEAPMTLEGEVNVLRGSYSFQGRRFSILPDSTVRFNGENFTNPTIDVSAEREISGVTALVHVAGTVREPRLALSSTPSLPEGDILSLIVFNQPMNQLQTRERVSLAARAGSLAARALATPLADSVARALDFDVFEISPTDNVEGAVLTVGRQVSDRLFVGFRQEFGSDDSSQVSFEYRLTEFLRIVTSFAQGSDRTRLGPRAERAAADFIFVIRR